jgi:hypothetical protein
MLRCHAAMGKGHEGEFGHAASATVEPPARRTHRLLAMVMV